MKVKIIRIRNNEECCIGELYIDDKFFCHTLEDSVRDKKIYGKTAIPTGKYKIFFDYSPRFKIYLPHILKENGSELDDFKGVRIHSGNTSNDTEGCILVGEWDKKSNYIANSRLTLNKLLKIFENNYPIPLEITNEF